ncbi:MAG TPA: hypothetical protein VE693_13095 [Gaiellaceae bacterium]|nr:hypothetical protein [Gaiellaceae bacterium]
MPLLPLPILLPPLVPLQLICGALGGWIFREKSRRVWAGVLLGLFLGLPRPRLRGGVPARGGRRATQRTRLDS